MRGSPQPLANFDVRQRKEKKKKKRQHTKLSKSFDFRPNCPRQGYNIPLEVCTAPTSDPSQETSHAATQPSSKPADKTPQHQTTAGQDTGNQSARSTKPDQVPKAVSSPVRESKTPAALYCGLNVAYRVSDPLLLTFKLIPRVCFSQKKQSPGFCTSL